MKVEDPSALLVQWFYHKPTYLPERRRVLMAKLYQICCPKCNNKTDFYRYGKMPMDDRSISAKNVGINGLKTIPANRPGVLGKKTIQAALFVGKRCMCTMIVNTTSTIPARTGNAGTPFLYQSLQLFQLRPCPNFLERQILSGCAIRSM